MKCINCGVEIKSDYKVCPFCGKTIQIVPDYSVYDEDDIIQLEGSFSLVKNNKNDYSLFYSIDVIEEQISMEFNIDYSVKSYR